MRRGRISENYLRHLVQIADWERIETSRRQLDLFSAEHDQHNHPHTVSGAE